MDVNHILKLSEAERILAVEKIWDSIEQKKIDLTPNQRKELDSRLSEYRAGKTKFFTWDEVKKELHAQAKHF
jgi:putative addiction module component (TIGR02574 family)